MKKEMTLLEMIEILGAMTERMIGPVDDNYYKIVEDIYNDSNYNRG